MDRDRNYPRVVRTSFPRRVSHWHSLVEEGRKFLAMRSRFRTVTSLCEAFNISQGNWYSIRRRILAQGTNRELIRCRVKWLMCNGPPPGGTYADLRDEHGNPRVFLNPPAHMPELIFGVENPFHAMQSPQDLDPISSVTHSSDEEYITPADLCPEDDEVIDGGPNEVPIEVSREVPSEVPIEVPSEVPSEAPRGDPFVNEPAPLSDSYTSLDELQSLRTDLETRVEALEELRLNLMYNLHQIDLEEDLHSSIVMRIRAEMEEENERHRSEIARLRASLN